MNDFIIKFRTINGRLYGFLYDYKNRMILDSECADEFVQCGSCPGEISDTLMNDFYRNYQKKGDKVYVNGGEYFRRK